MHERKRENEAAMEKYFEKKKRRGVETVQVTRGKAKMWVKK